MLKFVLSFVALTALLRGSANAKCGNSAITVRGAIIGPTNGTTVVVHISPDPNWEPQPGVSISDDGSFTAIVYFDRTKSEGSARDTCSRKPEDVVVELLKGAQVTDRVSLVVARDFAKKRRHDYELKTPMTLHSK